MKIGGGQARPVVVLLLLCVFFLVLVLHKCKPFGYPASLAYRLRIKPKGVIYSRKVGNFALLKKVGKPVAIIAKVVEVAIFVQPIQPLFSTAPKIAITIQFKNVACR